MITEYERFTITEYARQEAIRQVAARMLSQGVAADIIIQATGLSESDLKELASSEEA